MRHIKHSYSLSPDWMYQVAHAFDTEVVDNKRSTLPLQHGTGGTIFLEITSGFSVQLVDLIYTVPIKVTRTPTKEDMYVVYYDISDHYNQHIIDGTDHQVGYSSKFGMGFTDGKVESTFIPAVGERNFYLRLFIAKSLLHSMLSDCKPTEAVEVIFDKSKKVLSYYQHMESATQVLLNELKNRSFDDPAFELLLKGASLQIFSNLVRRIRLYDDKLYKLPQQDLENMDKSISYMTNDLQMDFPGIQKLAEIAGMSTSKYKTLFKKIMKDTPQQFFLNEKLLLAKELLNGGMFRSIKEVALELGYSQSGYFAAAYRKKFNLLPGENFIKPIE
ncbi:transcriptional regulator, AraC family [Sphingobacterium spiritivorum ATCC 33300]|uniref:Transcriptional regulator, AraC family n=1 Tax=Sphingobacterium spiritivorum ATCC 33300 TaxID=525372 RepID=C2FYS3_SPHSI|nr:AraC family transcriptional regulator [Sphingobacterium spiritivorum]EEI91908.1 transcriptional regulator, AraC family [Sphingobacterium spiritivorum ATCC 33300]QQS97080.1 helix-turn-helix transcriptional regulator [Sphingobacterium spiritivorum]